MNKFIYDLMSKIDLHNTKHYICKENKPAGKEYTTIAQRFLGIESNLGISEPSHQIGLMKVAELKQILKMIGLKTSGVKSELGDRIYAYSILRKNAYAWTSFESNKK